LAFLKSLERSFMMTSPVTITENNFPREDSPWMSTITPREENVFEQKSYQPTGLSPLVTGTAVITANLPTNLTIASQVITTSPKDTSRLGSRWDITTGSISQITITPSLSELSVYLGIQLAKMLAHTLDQVRVYNRQAIYPIMSILEPYIEEAEELVLDMPPIRSVQGIAEVIDRGRVEPDFYFE